MNVKKQTSLCEQHNSVLVLIDIQTQLTASMPLKVLARLQRNISLLIKSSTTLNIPTLVSEQESEKMGKLENTVAKLLPTEAKVYRKTTFSCMGAKDFLQDLKETKREQVILGGMEAHISVLQTAIELLQEGYQVFVVADAVSSRQRESYETGLQRLKQAGVIICDTESVLFEWLRDTSHKDFASTQSLF